MNLGFRRALPALALLGLAACGARSQLLGADDGGNAGGGGSGGSGGTPTTTGEGGTTTSSTTTTTTTTTGEGGGPQGVCAVLEYATPFASLVGGVTAHQRSPKMAYSADDGSRVTVATAWQFAETPNPPLELRRTSLEPWPTFPGTGLGNTNKMDLDGGASFAIAPSPGDRFALLFADFQESPPGGLRFSADFDPDAANPPDTILLTPFAEEALLLEIGKPGYLWAGRSSGAYHTLSGGIVDPIGGAITSLLLGCADTPPLAAAVAHEGSFLLAYTIAATEVLDCDIGAPGPAKNLFVARVNADGTFEGLNQVTSVATADLRLAARSGGAWIVWTENGGEDLPPSIQVGQLSAQGVYQPVNNMYANYQPGSVAVTSFEDFLVVAWIEAEPEGASPHVQVFTPDGTAAGAITVQATGLAKGPLSLLANPAARQAALAWSEEGEPGSKDQLRITRVDCLDN
jgi:hypothetical protein